MTPKLVIFDCDGVLVDSEPALLNVIAKEFAAQGKYISHEELERDYVGGAMSDLAARARAAGVALPEGWEQDIYTKLFAELRKGVPMMDGIVELLKALDDAGLPYCVGSNGPDAKMAITLGAHPELHNRLKDVLFSAHTYGTAKPDPGLFLIAADQMGVTPEDCVVIDDSPSGVKAGVAAGMRTFGFDPNGDGKRLTALGAEHLASLRDLPARIGLAQPPKV